MNNNSSYPSAPPLSPPTSQTFDYDVYIGDLNVSRSQPTSNVQSYIPQQHYAPPTNQQNYSQPPSYRSPSPQPQMVQQPYAYVSPQHSPHLGHPISPQPIMGRNSPQPQMVQQPPPKGRVSPNQPQTNNNAKPKKAGYTNILKQYEEEQLAKQQKIQLGLDFDEPQYQPKPQPTYDYPTSNIPYSDAPIGNFYPAVEPVPVYEPIVQPIQPQKPQKPQMDPRDAQLMKKFYPGKQ
jgi:hypothetical protein